LILNIKTPRWAKPLLTPRRYKGAKGGRGSGKSHFFAEMLVESHILNPDCNSVCIREIQKSLKFSAKKLIEDKIRAMGVSDMFDITLTEIRNKNGNGIIIFQGMQDHTADSIKSLEGFDIAWAEESQSISRRSIELLLPTIRKPGSEIWFSWNPYLDTDPVETMINWNKDDDSVCVHVNYLDNPFIDDILIKEAERHKRNKPDSFDHVWLGQYATKSDSQIFKDKYEIRDFEIDKSFGIPLFGIDFGFANDATTGVKVYIKNDILYIYEEAYKVGLELDDTAMYLKSKISEIDKYPIEADCARPESISYLKRNGLPFIRGVKKWKGSVIDGIEFIKSFDKIVIHSRCENTISEFRLYSYKVDKRTDNILPDVEDANNHIIDAIRYALEPVMKKSNLDYNILTAF
jgi:phage terminase, large subunit, PBSX family